MSPCIWGRSSVGRTTKKECVLNKALTAKIIACPAVCRRFESCRPHHMGVYPSGLRNYLNDA